MKKVLMTSAILTGLYASQTMAENYPDFEAYLGAGHYLWDSDRDLDDSTSLEGGIEIPVNELLSLEAWLSDFDADPKNGSNELDGNKYSLGALYHLSDDQLRPFLSVGGSHLEFDPSSGLKMDESLIYIGAGAKNYFDNNVVLRGELLATNSLDNELTEFGLRLAIGYAFGHAASASRPVRTNPINRTFEEPEAKSEEASSEPVAAKEEPAVKTPPVAEAPAVISDRDNDGVADTLDQCPDTETSYKVDETGCPVALTETVSINVAVTFASNSAEVSGNEGEIKKLADFLTQFKDTQVTVEGHTDDRGSARYNKALSQRRADAIKSALIQRYGIDAERVTALGLGEEQPMASNDTAEGRSANRRVVAEVSAKQTTLQTK